jgi:hypothetical protein
MQDTGNPRARQFVVREIDTGTALCIVDATDHAQAFARAGTLARLGLIAGEYGVEPLESRPVQTLYYEDGFFRLDIGDVRAAATGCTGSATEH